MSGFLITTEGQEQSSGETITWSVDLANWFPAGANLVALSAALLRRLDGSSYAGGLQGAMTASGTVMSQSVTALEPGVSYWLVFNCGLSGEVFAPALPLVCPTFP